MSQSYKNLTSIGDNLIHEVMKIDDINDRMIINNMDTLTIDLFFYLLRFISLDDAVSLCSVSKHFRLYGLSYKKRWEILRKERYGKLYSYPYVLEEISKKLPGLNHLISSRLVRWMDPVSQCILGYDNDELMVKFLANFILGKDLENIFFYETDDCNLSYMSLFIIIRDKYDITQGHLDDALYIMAMYGSVDGIIMIRNMGGNINYSEDISFCRAANGGHFDAVKYFLDHGTDIGVRHNQALIWAAMAEKLSMCKYLISKGAKITYYDITQAKIWPELERYINSLEKNEVFSYGLCSFEHPK